MSNVWFGALPFGGQTNEETARAMVRRCLDAGVTRFDTADEYCGGAAEEILGRALKGVRGATVATKVGAQFGSAPPESGLSKKWILKAIDASLKRLGMEAVDFYYMHQPDYRVPVAETLEAFQEIQQAGKVMGMGVSNFAAWQVMEMIALGRKPAISQQMLNLVSRSVEAEFVPFAKKYDIPMLSFNPLAGGLLTGKFDFSKPPLKGSRFDVNALYKPRYWYESMFKAVDRLSGIAREAGRTLVQLSLQWAAQRSDGVLIGATTLEQLEENLKGLEGTLDKGTMDACDEVWNDLRGHIPAYNR